METLPLIQTMSCMPLLKTTGWKKVPKHMRTHIYIYIYKYVVIMTCFTNGKKNNFQSVLVILVWWPNDQMKFLGFSYLDN